MEKRLIGRKREVMRLAELMNNDQSEFLAVYGRRRVGKTFLIKEYFQRNFTFHLVGLANATTDQQLFNFHATLSRHGAEGLEPPKHWLMAFQQLITHIEAEGGEGKKVLFLDEMPWMDTARSGFMTGLEHFWNGWVNNRNDILLIACGSAASWMINELINNTGGLHNRVTARIKLEPFDLAETRAFLESKQVHYDHMQIVQLYMAMGGIPYYLNGVRPELSAFQNIEALFFHKGAMLQSEFPKIFRSLFKRSETHSSIVSVLATKVSGLTRKEILAKSKLKSGGTFSTALAELEESGFVSSYEPLFKKVKQTTYRISDFYTLFYFRFIKDNKNYGDGVWMSMLDHPSQRAWSGYAYEQVCMSHLPQIKKALGISGIQTTSASWMGTDGTDAAQIDLLIDRRDQTISIIEVKYSIGEYAITKEDAAKLRRKVAVFKAATKTKKAVTVCMITTYGLRNNEHSGSLVQQSLDMEVLFG